MAELVLLSLDKTEFTQLYKASERGDQQAAKAINQIWEPYKDKELLCFLCDRSDCQPIFAQILPDNDRHQHQLLGAPLCLDCRQLPELMRLGKCLRLLKAMWKRQGKPPPVFHFNAARNSHHPR